MTGVFFDLDNTLLSTSSGLLWYKYLRKKRRITILSLAKIVLAYVRYRRNSLDVRTLAEKEVQKVAGMSEEEMIAICERWFDEMVKHYIYPRAVDVVNEHRAKGHMLVILSAATPYSVNPVMKHLDIEHGICTKLEIENGLFTGKIVEPYCYGEGKIYWAEQFAKEKGLRFEDCYFYTDSYTDLPMLEKVGMPRPVNSDRLLEAEARKRDWPTMKF